MFRKNFAKVCAAHDIPYVAQASVSNLLDLTKKAEKAFILKQLKNYDWNISKTAEALEIQRSHLYNKMKKYGIEKGE